LVILASANCEIVGNLYEHWLDVGAYKSKATEREAIENQSQRGASVSADLGASTGLSWKAKLAAGFLLGRKNKNSRSAELNNEQKARIQLIATNGQNQWRVGDSTLGDARRADRLLMGTYFNEERGKGGDSKPLCNIMRTKIGAEVNICASAPLGTVFVRSAHGEPKAVAMEETQAELRRIGALAARKHRVAESELRSQIAGLVVAQALRRAQLRSGVPLGEGNFLIAQLSLIINGSDEK
jgi:hypothetical protein